MESSVQYSREILARYGASPAEVAQHLRDELAAFEAALSRVPPERLFTPVADVAPAGGEFSLTWSPAQQLEHVLKANTTFSKLIYVLNSTRPLPSSPKDPGELANGRPVAPEGLRPGEGVTWASIEPSWREVQARLEAEILKTDPSSDRTFWHPFLGDLSAFDWGRVAALHTRRHALQLGVA